MRTPWIRPPPSRCTVPPRPPNPDENMAESTAQQVMDIRAGLSHALGAATNALDRAREAHAAARERRRRVGEAAGARRRKIAEARDARLREIDQRHNDDLAEYA